MAKLSDAEKAVAKAETKKTKAERRANKQPSGEAGRSAGCRVWLTGSNCLDRHPTR